MSAVLGVLAAVIAKVKGDASTSSAFQSFSTREFPLCDAFPALNVNATGVSDDFSHGMGVIERAISIRAYVTVNSESEEQAANDVTDLAEKVRAVLNKDRTLGGALWLPFLAVNVVSVPGPLGMNLIGARCLEFEGIIREAL